jgi:hypothetical protein
MSRGMSKLTCSRARRSRFRKRRIEELYISVNEARKEGGRELYEPHGGTQDRLMETVPGPRDDVDPQPSEIVSSAPWCNCFQDVLRDCRDHPKSIQEREEGVDS